MRTIKKFLAAGVTAAMVLGAVGVMPAITAKAAAPTVKYDASKHELTVTSEANKLVYMAVAKGTDASKYKYDAYQASGTEYKINLASVSTTKDVAYSIYTEASDPTTFTLKGNNSKLKAKVTSGGGLSTMLTVTSGTATMTASELTAAKIVVRAGNDRSTTAWQKFEDMTAAALEPYLAFGTTLYLRVQGSDTMQSGTTFMMDSKEIKVKMPKRGNAPKATIDYAKGTVKLPKNAEYAVGTDAFASTGANGATYYISDDNTHANSKKWSGSTVKVRTAANGSKPSSKIFALKVGTVTQGSAALPTATSGVSITVTTGQAVIENKNAKTIEYAFADAAYGVSTDLSALVWKPIKKDAKATIKKANSKTYVYFRIAGDKTKGSEAMPSGIQSFSFPSIP